MSLRRTEILYFELNDFFFGLFIHAMMIRANNVHKNIHVFSVFLTAKSFPQFID